MNDSMQPMLPNALTLLRLVLAPRIAWLNSARAPPSPPPLSHRKAVFRAGVIVTISAM